jgi:hypothetical protein
MSQAARKFVQTFATANGSSTTQLFQRLMSHTTASGSGEGIFSTLHVVPTKLLSYLECAGITLAKTARATLASGATPSEVQVRTTPHPSIVCTGLCMLLLQRLRFRFRGMDVTCRTLEP